MHPSILQPLLEFIPSIFQSLARGLDIVDADTGMSIALAVVLVTVAGLVVGVVLGAVVVGELDDAFAVGPVVGVGDGFGRVVGEEVEIELSHK